MSAPEHCAICRFFLTSTTKAFPDTDGMCRRYAPAGPITGDGRWQVFPPMVRDQWCGDFRPSDETPAIQRRIAA